MKKKTIIMSAVAAAAVLLPYRVEKDDKTGSLKINAIGYKISRDYAEGDITLSIPGIGFTLRRKGVGRTKSTPLFARALQIAAQKGQISADYIVRKLSVGQACAEAFVEMMQEYGILGERGDNGNFPVVADKEVIEELSQTIEA